MKPERIQKKDLPPFDVPMTHQRTQVRGAHLSASWQLLISVTGLQFHHRFASFQEAASFTDRVVGKIAEQIGYSPRVEIDGNDVVLTLGVDLPQILTEGDFDFAEAIDGAVVTQPGPEPEPPAAEA